MQQDQAFARATTTAEPEVAIDQPGNLDDRTTGEHVFDLSNDDELQAPHDIAMPAARTADLAAQIDFLDREVSRYRQLVESERIRHATQIAELALAHDTRIDELRREERRQSESLHHSYRQLLSTRQVAFDEKIARLTAEHAQQLADERSRYQDALAEARAHADEQIRQADNRAEDKVGEHYRDQLDAAGSELQQLRAALDRLQGSADDEAAATRNAEKRADEAERKLAELEQHASEREQTLLGLLDEVEVKRDAISRRLDAERQRSAATLSEVLERSAELAADADRMRTSYAAQLAKAEHAASAARLTAEESYNELAALADERANRALRREAELESVIAHLQARVAQQ